MKRIFFAFFLIANFAYAEPAVNEKILKVDSQNGTTQAGVISFVSKDASTLVVIAPGSPSLAKSSINFFNNKVQIQQDGSFVVRERKRLLSEEIATLVLDCRSDFATRCAPEYQISEQRFIDIKPLIELAKSEFSSIKNVWLLSTSLGLFTSAGVPKYSGDYFQGVIHTAGVVDLVQDYPTTNQFFFHHKDDPCNITKYTTAKAVADKINAPIVTVYGGSGFYGGACQAHTQHGFQGMEEKVMLHISNLIKTGKLDSLEIR